MIQYIYSIITDKRKGFITSTFKIFLFVLSLIYGLTVKLVSFICRVIPYRLDCKVISVGNITLGGTGKTPFVEMLTKYLSKEGHKVCILIRGYKRKNISCNFQIPNYLNMGDEAYLLSKNLDGVSILVGRDRIKNAKIAREKFDVDTIILDDGFQHWKLFRNLDIVLVDVKNPFGNGYLIPRGILREPLNSLRRAEIIVLTKTDSKEDLSLILEKIRRISPQAKIFKAKYQPQEFIDISKSRYSLSFIREKEICFVCGIADPDSFESTLSDLGAKIILKFIFFDHYEYKESDIDRIIGSCTKSNIKLIVTTEKDYVRLERFSEKLRSYLFVLRSQMEITEDEEGFFDRVDSLYLS